MGSVLDMWTRMAADIPRDQRIRALKEMAKREGFFFVSKAQLEALSNEGCQSVAEAADFLEDLEAISRFDRKLAAGEEELLPAAMVRRMIDGEHPVRVWREYRGLTGAELAAFSGVSASYLSEIERSEKPGSVAAMKKLAAALGVSVDDLV